MNQLIGGVLIGFAASILLLFNGRISGISGILGGILAPKIHDLSWRVCFIGGLILGGVIINNSFTNSFQIISSANLVDYGVGGFLVGVGTLMGSGCTSGHGVCGISRFSRRSMIATLIFILSGALSVFVFKSLRGDL